MPIATVTRMTYPSDLPRMGDPNEVRNVGKTAFATVTARLRRVMVIAGVLATLGVTAVPAQADQPTTFPDQAHGQQSSWSGPSFAP